ncbi:QsdR family transcriptional regulator [Amycolatopsis azurea]|uniref:QsdR family transcriptional regulator n=1 Tax=Amycolatopsis azurea TaxID=36819 RepID=UPI003808145B
MLASNDEIVRSAARRITDGVRLDLSALAEEFGMSRVTLFRRVGNRDELLGKALWWLADRTLTRASAAWERTHGAAVRDDEGWLRCLRIMADYGNAVLGNTGFQRLLDDEPATSIRVLTDPFGQVQPQVIAAHLDLLKRDVTDAGLTAMVDLETLAYTVVRMGESIMYSELIAGRTRELSAATTMINTLVEGVLRAS